MALVGMLCKKLASCTLKSPAYGVACAVASQNLLQQTRFYNIYKVRQPTPATTKKNLRFKVHYPEDGEYTVKPLKMTKLGGRDPVTGRIIHGAIGGGHKRNYRWIDTKTRGPSDGTFLEERVINIIYDPNRDAKVAVVGSGDKLRYRIATTSMKVGDLIKTSSYIPRMTVRPADGDTYPLGALPVGTQICCLELSPGEGSRTVMSAGSIALVKRKLESKIVVQMPSKKLLALDPACMATVGQVSNAGHKNEHIGSAQRNRWLGNRPRSGLWQRKKGYQGRKIKSYAKVKNYVKKVRRPHILSLTLNSELSKSIVPATRRVT